MFALLRFTPYILLLSLDVVSGDLNLNIMRYVQEGDGIRPDLQLLRWGFIPTSITICVNTYRITVTCPWA